MKLKELIDTVATNSNVGKQTVNSVVNETFRQIRATLEKGERVTVPDFGVFNVRTAEAEGGEPAKKTFKFRAATGETGAKRERKNKEGGKEARKEGRKEGRKREKKAEVAE
jgi:nucleoid DNA-binding protein